MDVTSSGIKLCGWLTGAASSHPPHPSPISHPCRGCGTECNSCPDRFRGHVRPNRGLHPYIYGILGRQGRYQQPVGVAIITARGNTVNVCYYGPTAIKYRLDPYSCFLYGHSQSPGLEAGEAGRHLFETATRGVRYMCCR